MREWCRLHVRSKAMKRGSKEGSEEEAEVQPRPQSNRTMLLGNTRSPHQLCYSHLLVKLQFVAWHHFKLYLFLVTTSPDVYGWPISRCTYPPSLKSSSWTEISGRLTFTFNSANDVITIHSQRKHTGASTATTHARATLKCLKADQSQNASSGTFASDDDDDDAIGHISNYSNITVLAHVLEKWWVKKRTEIIMTFQGKILWSSFKTGSNPQWTLYCYKSLKL